MEKIWCNKTVQSLNSKQKDEIINMVFDTCINNDELCDIGGDIFKTLSDKGYIWQEEFYD